MIFTSHYSFLQSLKSSCAIATLVHWTHLHKFKTHYRSLVILFSCIFKHMPYQHLGKLYNYYHSLIISHYCKKKRKMMELSWIFSLHCPKKHMNHLSRKNKIQRYHHCSLLSSFKEYSWEFFTLYPWRQRKLTQ